MHASHVQWNTSRVCCAPLGRGLGCCSLSQGPAASRFCPVRGLSSVGLHDEVPPPPKKATGWEAWAPPQTFQRLATMHCGHPYGLDLAQVPLTLAHCTWVFAWVRRRLKVANGALVTRWRQPTPNLSRVDSMPCGRRLELCWFTQRGPAPQASNRHTPTWRLTRRVGSRSSGARGTVAIAALPVAIHGYQP